MRLKQLLFLLSLALGLALLIIFKVSCKRSSLNALTSRLQDFSGHTRWNNNRELRNKAVSGPASALPTIVVWSRSKPRRDDTPAQKSSPPAPDPVALDSPGVPQQSEMQQEAIRPATGDINLPLHLELSKEDRRQLRGAQTALFNDLRRLQFNPAPHRFLRCHLGLKCGFGCRVHRLAVCLHQALRTNRTMLLTAPETSPYSTGQLTDCTGWTCFFQPYVGSREETRGADIMSLSVQSFIHNKNKSPIEDEKYLSVPLAVYGRIAPARLWLVGQLVGWLLRPSSRLERVLLKTLEHLNLRLPVEYGVHIRMTDKLAAEAKLHVWREYFQHVDHRMKGRDVYYHSFAGMTANTSAFVATDEPAIFGERGRSSIGAYTHNRIVWNTEGLSFRDANGLVAMTSPLTGAKLAETQETRYSQASLDHLLCDLYIMASARYFVGTFSSQGNTC